MVRMNNYKEMKTGLQASLTDNYHIILDLRRKYYFCVELFDGDMKTYYTFENEILKTNSAKKVKNTKNMISEYFYDFDDRGQEVFEFDNKQGKKAFQEWFKSFLITEFNLNEYYFNFNSYIFVSKYKGVCKEMG